MDRDTIKEKLLQELESYQNNKANFKPYMQSMKEMTAWFNGMSK